MHYYLSSLTVVVENLGSPIYYYSHGFKLYLTLTIPYKLLKEIHTTVGDHGGIN